MMKQRPARDHDEIKLLIFSSSNAALFVCDVHNPESSHSHNFECFGMMNDWMTWGGGWVGCLLRDSANSLLALGVYLRPSTCNTCV
jgi:hypothetical protein